MTLGGPKRRCVRDFRWVKSYPGEEGASSLIARRTRPVGRSCREVDLSIK